jgi:hypothetical protein
MNHPCRQAQESAWRQRLLSTIQQHHPFRPAPQSSARCLSRRLSSRLICSARRELTSPRSTRLLLVAKVQASQGQQRRGRQRDSRSRCRRRCLAATNLAHYKRDRRCESGGQPDELVRHHQRVGDGVIAGGPDDDWLIVQAPTRRHNQFVWVPSNNFDFGYTSIRIEIDLADGGCLTLFDTAILSMANYSDALGPFGGTPALSCRQRLGLGR